MQLKSLVLALCIPMAAQAADLNSNPKAKAVVNRYADIVHATYVDALQGTEAMQVAIEAFLANPNAENLEAAKKSWLSVRDVWGHTEAFRFYEGPIDSTEGVEGMINAWPLDEAYIDYVADAPNSGIINNPELYPVISEESLMALNEAGAETNVATGYHAVEFLLWGQDLSLTGPGARPYTDFVVGSGASHVERRRAYLAAATSLLVRQISTLVAAWDPAVQENYSASFRNAPASESLTKIYKGIISLLGDELAGERMYVGYESQSQEDEHSCFSDNTTADVIANVQSAWNVYFGQYAGVDGPGLDELSAELSLALAKKVETQLISTQAAVSALPIPYDSLVTAEDGSDLRKVFLETIFSVQDAAAFLTESAQALGIQVGGEEAQTQP